MVETAGRGLPLPAVKVADEITEWLDGRPRMGLDVNGIPLILHIPGWLKEKSLVGKPVGDSSIGSPVSTTGELQRNMLQNGGGDSPDHRGWSGQKLPKSQD